MSRWFRHYAGMMRDDKLVRVALRSKQPIERVCWIWGAILESAAEIDDAGRYDLDAAEAAYFLRADEADVASIVRELVVAGRIDSERVAKWGARQFQSDRSAERVALHRRRKREADVSQDTCNGAVTLQEQPRNSPETEAELEAEETPIVPLAGGRGGKSFIPEDWKAPLVSELPPRSRACAEQWTDASYQTEAEAFVCYWRSERKMKGNWRDTWCNRIVARHEAVMRAQKFGNSAPSGGKVSRAQQIENLRALADMYDRQQRRDEAQECRRKIAALETRQAA